MIRIVFCFLILTVATSLAHAELRIVFVGNSLTGVNNLPGLFRTLANDQGFHPYVEQHLRFGQTLDVHLADPDVRKSIQTGDWDYVVLQDFSNLVLTHPDQLRAHVEAFQKLLGKGSKARVVMAENWAYQNAPIDTQTQIDKTYGQVARETGTAVVPLGRAFNFVKLNSLVGMFKPNDDRHPSTIATYMLSTMYLETFYGIDPRMVAHLGSTSDTPSVTSGEAVTPVTVPLEQFVSLADVETVQQTAKVYSHHVPIACAALFR